ncbi:cell filamentation protein Fic [Megamonas hypermegale]|uniref:protein adenylyltransferase n=2 Tax=Megamonas hypermegale TaxID=158847 RepID=A0A239TZI5_9FIRM|nr:Fic family protein [Megamonas hypermegale]SNV03217.1 cell filamentation protein Fic [Megamonas hypermegale]
MSEKDMEEKEGLYIPRRLIELKNHPIEGNFDLKHLCKINQYLFQDLPKLGGKYERFYKPGQYITELLPWKTWMKHRPIPGTSKISNIVYSNMDKIIINETQAFLKKNIDINKMKKMQVKTFVKKMTEIYSKLDYLHPFRDGNSRTIREFTRELALKAGFKMNWEKSNLNQHTRNELYIARDLAVNKIAHDRAFSMELKYDIEMYMKPFKDCKKLEEILAENIEKIKVRKQKIVMKFPDKDKSNNRNIGR